MQKEKPQAEAKGGRTLLTALLLSAPGPLVTGIAALTSRSATQLADFIRRTAELVATFVSWLMFRRIHGGAVPDAVSRARLERIANRTVATSMIVSGAALFVIGVWRLLLPRTGGASVMGLVIAALGLVVNAVFFLRYRAIVRRKFDAVIAAQQRLYRAKVAVDLCVVLALLLVALLPGHPVSQAVDAVGSIIVAAYLLMNGIQMLRRRA